MSFNERLSRLENELTEYDDPVIAHDLNIHNGEFRQFRECDFPPGWRALPAEVQLKEIRRAIYTGRWRDWNVPEELDAAAAQLAADEEFPDTTSPHDVEVSPETEADIHQHIQCRLDEINADKRRRHIASAIPVGDPWLIDDPLIGPSPRIAGRYARKRNETEARGEPWYGSFD